MVAAESNSNAAVPLRTPRRRDHEHRFRLQVFPDGRCSITADGRQLFVARASGSPWPLPPFRLFIYGSTHGAPVLIRRVRVVTGVADDVAWKGRD